MCGGCSSARDGVEDERCYVGSEGGEGLVPLERFCIELVATIPVRLLAVLTHHKPLHATVVKQAVGSGPHWRLWRWVPRTEMV